MNFFNEATDAYKQDIKRKTEKQDLKERMLFETIKAQIMRCGGNPDENKIEIVKDDKVIMKIIEQHNGIISDKPIQLIRIDDKEFVMCELNNELEFRIYDNCKTCNNFTKAISEPITSLLHLGYLLNEFEPDMKLHEHVRIR